METTFQYLRQFGPLLAERILETYPPMQSTKDPVAPRIATLLRKALPAQALAITGTAKYLRGAKAARIVAECGAGKTYMALGTMHVLADGRPSTTLVMCPSHITHKWAREVLLTIPRARAFLIEDLRNGGDPNRPHGICEVKLSKGKTVYEGTTPLSVAGTAEELDAELPSALVQFVGAHLELRNTLESVKEQMAAAAKTAKAEARSRAATKTAPVPTEPAAAETKKPADAAPKPAEPRKQEPARNASLFDTGPSPESAPLSAPDADDEEEILTEAGDDEPADEPDDLDEAA